MLNIDLINDNICTQGYHLIDNFLEIADYQSLRQFAIKMHQHGLFRSAQIGNKLQKQQNSAIRTDEIYWLDENSNDPAIHAYLKQTSILANSLNQTLFLGLAEFETHFATYNPGTFYKKHIDQFASKKTRKISCVYYLNEDWQNDFGGELKLYTKENQFIRAIFPQGNRFICFNSELPHEVALTHKTRYSISGWMKTASNIYPVS